MSTTGRSRINSVGTSAGRSRSLSVFGYTPNRPRSTSEAPSTTASATASAKPKTTFPQLVYELMGRVEREARDNAEDQTNRTSHMHVEGGKVWEEFNRHATALGRDLQKLQDAVHEVGSSLELVRSAKNIRDSLHLTSWVVRENARKLFPQTVKSGQPPQIEIETTPMHRPSWPPPHASESHVDHHFETRPIHIALKEMGKSVESFRNALAQFPEFDNFGSFSLICFEGDLKYWSSCLDRYQGQFETREVQIYIHDLSQELGQRFAETSRCLKDYIACVPSVRLSQKHAMSNLQNLATVATFFSAVTATTIQFSYTNTGTSVAQAVNFFWFSSLVFSIASALNSFLFLTWRRAIYSSPQLRIPWWLWIWIRQCPPIFLLISVVTFLLGLSCFTVSVQPRLIWIVVICEGISSFGLAALLVWLAADKWSFYRLQRQQEKPTFPLIRVFTGKPGSVLPTHIEHSASWSVWYVSSATTALSSITARLKARVFPRTSPPNLPTAAPEPDIVTTMPRPPSGTPTGRSSSLPPGQQRWRRAIRRVIFVLKSVKDERQKELQESRRITEGQPRLRQLSVSEELEQDDAGAAISGMQFHPEGHELAICGKRLSMRCELGTSRRHHLKHHIGQARQVIWSYSGDYLLTRTHRAIHVWTSTGDLDHRTVIRYETSNFFLAVPNSRDTPPRFISIEGRGMNKLSLIDVRGEEQWNHEFDDISISHADVVPETSSVLLTATSPQSTEGFKPMKASFARKLIAFNLASRQVEHEVPLWHDAKHVTVSGNGMMAIVTYENYPPPQLWRLHNTPSGIRLYLERQFCARERESALDFDPLRAIKFSGRGQFLNKDGFIFCATTEGKIHFWRRDKADPVYVLSAITPSKDGSIQVESNPASDDFMFATRSQDGHIRVWKARDPAPLSIRVDTGALTADDREDTDNGTLNQLHALSESPQVEQSEQAL